MEYNQFTTYKNGENLKYDDCCKDCIRYAPDKGYHQTPCFSCRHLAPAVGIQGLKPDLFRTEPYGERVTQRGKHQ